MTVKIPPCPLFQLFYNLWLFNNYGYFANMKAELSMRLTFSTGHRPSRIIFEREFKNLRGQGFNCQFIKKNGK